jgi:hypothetical protein
MPVVVQRKRGVFVLHIKDAGCGQHGAPEGCPPVCHILPSLLASWLRVVGAAATFVLSVSRGSSVGTDPHMAQGSLLSRGGLPRSPL